MLAEVPAIIAEQGRVAGFEHLRDRLLLDWEKFIARGVNAYSALKLVIEMDRHGMFAEVQARKQQGQFDRQLYADFQDYLHGEPNADPIPDGGAPLLPDSPYPEDGLPEHDFGTEDDTDGEEPEDSQ